MEWTKQQQKAIDEQGRSILVSAAAGSGKTAVMVQRIQHMIMDCGYSIDRMLIVTFTNAAASEMREKIRKSLKKASKKDPKLRRQLELMQQANISTFHAFAQKVIRKYFYLTELKPSFSIADEPRTAILKNEALDELFDSCYESGNADFRTFLDWYSSEKDDEAARELILNIHTAIMALPDPFETLDEYIGMIGMPENDLRESQTGKAVIQSVKEMVRQAADNTRKALETLKSAGVATLANKMLGPVSDMNQVEAAVLAEDYDEAARVLGNMDWPRADVRKANEKEAYQAVKGTFLIYKENAKALQEKLLKGHLSEPLGRKFTDVGKAYGVAQTFGRLIKGFDAIFARKKRELNIIDFNDVEHFCLDILRRDDVAAEYRELFDAIFIDEYQDTSVLQEAIVERIKRDDNLFMVGDIKQSIYKFRLAEPEIFQDKYDKFAKLTGDPAAKEMKIDLNSNFRSKPGILKVVNDIFEPIMDGYDDDAKLYAGLPEEVCPKEYSFEPELVIAENPRGGGGKKKSIKEICEETLRRKTGEGQGDEVARLKDREIEALLIALLIKENLGTPYFDSAEKRVKELRYRDIVILRRSLTVAPDFFKILQALGIPLYIDDSGEYFDRVEINVFMNLLSVIDNKFQDIPLLSVMRSEIFGFSVEELAEIRLAHNTGSYAEAFLDMCGKTGELAEKCLAAKKKLRRWKELSLAMPLPDLIWRLLIESGYYLAAGALPDGRQRQANLRMLCDRARDFSETAQNSLYSFIKYVEMLRRRKISNAQAKLLGEGEDVVRLMTIHKSKGLQFPMVIVAGVGSDFHKETKTPGIVFHKDVGLGMILHDPDRHLKKKSLIYDAILERRAKEELEENIRILYVAMTRAKEKLFLTGVVPKVETLFTDKENGKTNDKNYLGLFRKLPKCRVVPVNGEAEGHADAELPEAEIPGGEKPGSEISGTGSGMETASETGSSGPGRELERIVSSRLDYRYPHENAKLLRAKYSVSALNRESFDPAPEIGSESTPRMPSFDKPKFMQGARRLSFAEKGTVYHSIMERIDFARAEKDGLSYIKDEAGRMVEAGKLTQEELDAVDLGKIARFFGTETGKACAEAYAAGKLYREQSFDILFEKDGEKVMVQGIIDCFYESEDGIVLVDYKSNRIDENRPAEEEFGRLRQKYEKQLEIYRMALEKGTGKPVTRAMLYLFDADTAIEV